ELPDELREIVPVLLVAGATALGGEVELVPPLELRLGRQRNLSRFLAADQIAAHRDERLAALGPQRGDDGGRARSPVEAGQDRLADRERVHESDDVGGKRGRLAVAERVTRTKARRAVAAQVRD